jgi:hypothetical protein
MYHLVPGTWEAGQGQGRITITELWTLLTGAGEDHTKQEKNNFLEGSLANICDKC